jgi:hypothetical protein
VCPGGVRGARHRPGKPRPKQDVDSNPGHPSHKGRALDSDGGLGIGWLTALGRWKRTVEVCVPQPLRLGRADHIKRGGAIERWFPSSIIGCGVIPVTTWRVHARHIWEAGHTWEEHIWKMEPSNMVTVRAHMRTWKHVHVREINLKDQRLPIMAPCCCCHRDACRSLYPHSSGLGHRSDRCSRPESGCGAAATGTVTIGTQGRRRRPGETTAFAGTAAATACALPNLEPCHLWHRFIPYRPRSALQIYFKCKRGATAQSDVHPGRRLPGWNSVTPGQCLTRCLRVSSCRLNCSGW